MLPKWDQAILWPSVFMRIIARRALTSFWKKHPDSEGPLRAWFVEARRASWRSMVDVKRQYATASVVDSERVVFNIGGNKYRLVVKLWFAGNAAWIKFIGSHKSYDTIDVKKL